MYPMDLCQTHCEQVPEVAKVNKIGFLQFLPMGQHELCFGYLFSGPLPLCSLIIGPPIGVSFRDSLVFRLYSEIDHIHLSSEAQCVSHLLPPGDCHNGRLLNTKTYVCAKFCLFYVENCTSLHRIIFTSVIC